MTRLLCLFLALAAPLCIAAERQPNVVLIMADDLGYECLACNGSESYQTPHLDKLAAGGVRFTQCHVQPLCTPTRVMLMTGKSNVRNYTHFGHLDPTQTTFGHLFKKSGYATCITGKWQLGGGLEGPGHFGFDEYCLWQLNRRPERYKNPGLEINGKQVDYTQGEYGPDLVNDYALDFITRSKDKPFFLYYPLMLVHSPYQATPDSTDYDKPSGTKDAQRHFVDMVNRMDQLVGKVVAKLDELKLRDNTLLIFLGDNGTGRGTPTQFKGREVQGGKGNTTTWGTHVPAIGSWPGQIASGKVCDDLIDTSDFLPTICAAASVTIPADFQLDGRSFLPQLKGEKGTPREWLYSWYNPSGGPKAQAEFAHDAGYKLYSDGRFFNVAQDDKEKSPLKDDGLDAADKDAKAKLQQALKQFEGARPAAIAAQHQAFGGEGKAKKNDPKKGDNKKKKKKKAEAAAQ